MLKYREIINNPSVLKGFRSADLVQLQCEHCDAVYEKVKHHIQIAIAKGSKSNFCCRACQADSVDTRITRQCSHCGKDVYRPASQFVNKDRIYCSRSCAVTVANAIPKRASKYKTAALNYKYGKTSENKRIYIKLCRGCDQEYVAQHLNGKFCCIDCGIVFRYKTIKIPEIEAGLVREPRTLRRYLSNLRGPNCSDCGQPPLHNGKPLTIQLDHIDGDSDNNFPSNLRLLCPNCHTQTDTFGVKGLGSRNPSTPVATLICVPAEATARKIRQRTRCAPDRG